MKRRGALRGTLLALALVLAALGLWQAGGAAYIHAKAFVAQMLLESAWRARMAGIPGAAARPWPWADTAPVGRLIVPRLDVDRIVLAGASGRTLAFAPGHLDGSAPIGRPGHTVIGGHRDTHFAFLRDIRTGDTIEVESPDGRRVGYTVDGTAIVDSRTARLRAIGGGSALTLVTCYPFDTIEPGGPLRLAVFARADAR